MEKLNNPRGPMYLIARKIAEQMQVPIEQADAAVEALLREGLVPDYVGMLQDALDLLDKGCTDVAKAYLTDLIEQEAYLGTKLEPMSYVGAFDSSFKTACRKHSVIAAYLVLTDLRQTTGTKATIDTGGHHLANAYLMNKLDPGRFRQTPADIAKRALEAIDITERRFWRPSAEEVPVSSLPVNPESK